MPPDQPPADLRRASGAQATAAPTGHQDPRPSTRSQRGLDWLNFFVADVETAFGPFLAVYLSAHGWRQGWIGTVLTVNTAVGLATETPAGALVDWTRRKRMVLLVCIACIAAGSLLIGFFPSYYPVLAGEVLHGITGGAVRTAMAAIALGLVGHRAFHIRVGRNQRYESLGNAATAAGMGALGQFASLRAPFLATAGLCLPAAGSLALIQGREIDYARARHAEGRTEPQAARWTELLGNRPLLIFAGCLFLFQFADASMLPLAGERLAADYQRESLLMAAALVVVPQLVTALIAGWLARKADEWGRKVLLLAAFGALAVRAALFAVAFSPWYLVGVQVLGAAMIGLLMPLVVADLTKGTGRYNFSFGAVGMIAAIGATVSTTAVGFLAQEVGFSVGFLSLAAAALLGFGVLWRFMPETVHAARSGPGS